MKIVAEANHVSITIAKIRVKKTHAGQTLCVLSQIKEQAVLVRLEWFQALQLKLAAFDHRLFHVQKIVIVLKLLLVSMTSVDQFAQMTQAV